MNKKRWIVIILVLVITSGLSGAEQKSYDIFDQSLGVQFGQISGSGLSWQKRFGDDALQVALGIMYSGDPSLYLSILNYTVGLEYQHTLYGDDFANWLGGQIYLFAGFNHSGFIDWNDDRTAAKPIEFIYALGGGIGVEVLLFKHFSVPVECGYAAYWNPSKVGILQQLYIDLFVQAGLRYRF
ncbi:MAG: hypothetical protein WC129_04295 [Sphaerochaetaceae bacterium]|jgi:hypothetical protein